MATYASPRYRRVFAQLQSTNFRTVNNSGGTWSNTGAKLIRVPENAIKMTPNMPITPVPWLTGTRSNQPGVRGRKSAGWSLSNVPVIPSGTAGTAPDLDPILQNIVGQAPTIVPSTSAAYNFNDTGYLPLSLFNFYHGVGSLTQQLIWGCFTTQADFLFNGDVFTANFSGTGGFVLESASFAAEDTVAKAGLTSFPSEPVSPTYAGSIIPGFGATCAIDGQQLETEIRSLSIRITTGYRLIGDVLSDFYPVLAVGGARQVVVTVGVIDSDAAALINLKQKAKSSSAPTVPLSCTVGTTPGSKVKFDVNGIQFVPYDHEDQSDIVMANFPEATAHATAVGNVDDAVITFL